MSLEPAEFARLLLAVALLMIAAHGVGHVFVKLRQPRVIGEITGGLLLGPTLFGAVAPGVYANVFPKEGASASFLGGVYSLGLTFLMFCSGVELRAVFRRGEERVVSLVTVTGVVIPFLLGLLAVRVVDTGTLMGPAKNDTALTLVFALAIAVTSIPVISRIMFDLGVLHTSFARIVLGVAVLEDTVVYVILAIALGLVAGAQGGDFGVPAALGLQPGTAGFLSFHVAATLLFCLLMLTVAPPMFRRSLRLRLNVLKRSSHIGYQLVFLFLATFSCVLLGITALLGAFLAGIAVSTATGPAVTHARDAIREFSFAFFVPAYFALVGQQLNLLRDFNLLFFLVFLLFACVVKSLSVYVGARLAGERDSAAWNLAIAMNARGGPGIVLASVAYAAGIVNQEFYAALVMLAVVTSLAAGSWLGRIVRSGRPLRTESEKAVPTPASR
jgi:Kef-type K+ transport system membrane component KefB